VPTNHARLRIVFPVTVALLKPRSEIPRQYTVVVLAEDAVPIVLSVTVSGLATVVAAPWTEMARAQESMRLLEIVRPVTVCPAAMVLVSAAMALGAVVAAVVDAPPAARMPYELISDPVVVLVAVEMFLPEAL